MNCSICFAKIDDERKTCNAYPINTGRCCFACDDLIVTPVRTARASGQRIATAVAVALIMHEQSRQLRAKKEMESFYGAPMGEQL